MEMDKLVLLLLLGVFSFMSFQGVAPATLCMVCKIFKKGTCLKGNGSCTVEEGPGCRTRDISFFHVAVQWRYNHTELDCSSECKAWQLIRGNLKVSSFCCEGQDFCNQYRGKSLRWTSHGRLTPSLAVTSTHPPLSPASLVLSPSTRAPE